MLSVIVLLFSFRCEPIRVRRTAAELWNGPALQYRAEVKASLDGWREHWKELTSPEAEDTSVPNTHSWCFLFLIVVDFKPALKCREEWCSVHASRSHLFSR